MTDIKFDSKVLEDVKDALAPHTTDMFTQRKGRWMAVVELAHVERVEPGPDEDKFPSVKVRIVAIEVADNDFADERLRELQRGLYRLRTKGGTLDGELDPDVQNARDVLKHGSGLLVGSDA
ncbi:hypothetical protein DCW30_05675 [Streptomyces alfalfae]|uniref:Uncharacterized protein n=1 Tax=Streptomyces alfalfae TaxID=1642299 RepID=A0ABN4VQX0_9ACTN|nr:hypothetical protein [Streptomyces alfalfae]APY88210.1 hypothetical protein A7J05_23200 [Streptomyces alfalfae]AYA18605.1 hypothetical protein D3X13_22310 [Streptomyces fradiae]RXX46515.1 hypothetical protein DCW30_05675 [Streptomyces alfalfae]RZM90028.1 hypothetical protein D4104_25610 [Streptomyces alfalfae]